MACAIYNKSYFENFCKIQRKVTLLKSNLIKLHVILKHDNAWKMSEYGDFSSLYFAVFGKNTVKYRPEISLYFDFLQAVRGIDRKVIIFLKKVKQHYFSDNGCLWFLMLATESLPHLISNFQWNINVNIFKAPVISHWQKTILINLNGSSVNVSWKMSEIRFFFLDCFFPYLDWIRRSIM